MATRARPRKDSDADSVGSAASEPVITRSRSTTPFTLRSQCTRHGSECPEGHGMNFRNRLKFSPRSNSKKSPRKNVIGTHGSIIKNLARNLEAQHPLGHPDYPVSSKTSSREKLRNHTSDYSSAEEEEARRKDDLCTTSSTFASTPPPINLKTTPLKRSAEKTDYTYAKSYSYRTKVTPERVICMPNMTRRSIERCHGVGFSSPELRFGSVGKSADINTNYANGHESDLELDDKEPYQLKTPPRTYSSAAYCFSSVAYSKMRGMMFSLAWWIYLITCYSLLLDTCVLQSRGITKLRDFCRQRIKINRNLLMLFLFLPLCFFAGGLLYSALHVFNFRTEDKPPNTKVNPLPSQESFPPSSTYSNLLLDSPSSSNLFPPSSLNPSSDSSATSNHFSSSLNPLVDISSPSVSSIVELPPSTTSPITAPLHLVDDPVLQNIKNEWKLTKDALLTLKQKINNYDGKMSDVVTQVGLFQLVSLSATQVRDHAASSEILEGLVDAKLTNLITSLSEKNRLDVDKIAATVSLLNKALEEVKELKEWKRAAEEKHEKWDSDLSELQHRMNGIGSLSSQMGIGVEEAIKRWELNSKPALIQKIKEELLNEIGLQIKLLNDDSGQGLGKDEVEQLIHSALGVYDSDKTGLADYALEPAGGVVLSTRCTETYNSHRPRLSIWGFSLWSEPNNPRVVIQPGIVPGQCWSFRGFDGYLVIQLSRKIIPTAFTLEHIPRSLAPDGQIDSAPRNFTVYGLTKEVDIAGVELGHYTYDNLGTPLQSFQVQARSSEAFSIVELRIHSNYGNLNYTCLYRFRVHGQVA
ncbi:uncharacterized protein LOC130688242 isoform X2 [Daphnia carinata]|uniref:uncharacterized protein LOC130688242 isoform X2 n=1 Tax=Daphnia carinata TaxID=120202 RepID=UPI00286931C3|nr:uncharacterized protein LOC130688242 isoform X2 [Daphnia carinata]